MLSSAGGFVLIDSSKEFGYDMAGFENSFAGSDSGTKLPECVNTLLAPGVSWKSPSELRVMCATISQTVTARIAVTDTPNCYASWALRIKVFASLVGHAGKNPAGQPVV